MKKVSRNVLRIVERVTREGVRRNLSVWPPDCSGILYQPKRPIKSSK